MRRTILLPLVLVLLHPAAADAKDLQAGINFLAGVPQGEFRRNVDNTGFGIAGTIGWSPERAPLMLGLELGYMVYGSETRREPFSSTIPNVFVDVTTTNSFFLGHLFLRLQPNTGSVRPYIQGMVGLHYLSTRTAIENSSNTSQEIASSEDLSDNAFSYGGGGGLMICVWGRDEGESEGLEEVLIDVGARYVLGREARYLKEGSIRIEGGRAVYDVSRSRTDLLGVQVGVSFRF